MYSGFVNIFLVRTLLKKFYYKCKVQIVTFSLMFYFTGVAAFAGLLFGLITMLVQYVGLFISGLHTGVLLGLASLLAADHFIETSPQGSVWLCVGVLLASALLFAVLSLYFRKCKLYKIHFPFAI